MPFISAITLKGTRSIHSSLVYSTGAMHNATDAPELAINTVYRVNIHLQPLVQEDIQNGTNQTIKYNTNNYEQIQTIQLAECTNSTSHVKQHC